MIFLLFFTLLGCNMEYAKLASITADSQHWTVKVHVTRFSNYIGPDNPDKILRLDLILLDEEVYCH